MKLRYTDRARQDLELAFIWYERQLRGLGLEFLDCVESGIKSILDNPNKFQICYSHFRGRIINRFPFSIFYSIEDNEIVVHDGLITGKIQPSGLKEIRSKYCHVTIH